MKPQGERGVTQVRCKLWARRPKGVWPERPQRTGGGRGVGRWRQPHAGRAGARPRCRPATPAAARLKDTLAPRQAWRHAPPVQQSVSDHQPP